MKNPFYFCFFSPIAICFLCFSNHVKSSLILTDDVFLALSHFASLCRGKMRQLPLLGFPRFIANKLFRTFFFLYISCCESTSHTQVRKKIQIAMPYILQQ